jgi:hypothetical protein
MTDDTVHITFKAFKNDKDNPKAPSYSCRKFVLDKDLNLTKGTVVDIDIWEDMDKNNKPYLNIKVKEPYQKTEDVDF